MPGAIIHIDLDYLLPVPPDILLVEHVSDYPAAYLRLRETFHTSASMSLWIRDRTVATWFSRVAATYGDAYITLHYHTAKRALAERWHVSIPLDVSDREIVQSGLLELPIVAREGQTFWDTLLEYFYGSSFTYKAFPQRNLAVLLNSIHEQSQGDAHQRPLVARALHEKLAQWEHAALNEVTHALVHRLATQPKALQRDITHYILLRDYPPSLGRKVLGELWDLFQKAHIQAEDLILHQDDKASVLPDIEYYFTSCSDRLKSIEDAEILLEQMSGYLSEEFQMIESLIYKHPEWLTRPLLHRIEQRFLPIREGIEGSLSQLRHLVRPEPPRKPEVSWQVDQWLRWVQDDYMPYYCWLDTTGQHDPTIASFACMFADWYYDHFVAIKHGHPEHFAFNALYQEREAILEENAVTLILVLDNMNFAYFDDLRRLFNQHNFSLQGSGVKPVLSLIPTATEVGKSAIMAGRGDQMDLPSDHYRTLIFKEWRIVLRGKRITYIENIGELQRQRGQNHDVYFVNYLSIDKILHEDSNEIGQPHAEMVHDRLKALVDAVVAFAKRFQIENSLHVYTISDHGSTRISQHIVNVLDKEFFRGIATDSHHRFIALSDEKLASLPQAVEQQCYIIDRHRFQTYKNYLAARQYYRFVVSKGDYYVHGGLAPEEVVVPFAHFAHKRTIPLVPSLRLLVNQFRYAVKSAVQLEVGNPNAYTLEALRFRLMDAEAEEHFEASIAPKQEIRITIPTIFRKTPGAANERLLTVHIRYEYQGQIFGPQEQTFEVTMKSLMEVNDDDFDF